MSSLQELLVGPELPSQVSCVLDTGEKGWGHGSGAGRPRQEATKVCHSLGFLCIADHVIEQKFLLCKSGIGAWTYVTLLKTGREIVVRASYDSLANPCQKSQHQVCTRPGGWSLGVGTATQEEERDLAPQ